MGSWFAHFLATNGYRIIIWDKNKPAARKLAKTHGFKFVGSQTQAAELADIILLATPTHITPAILKKIIPNIPKRALLVEISSIKEPIRKLIQTLTRRGVRILSIHPMFGPGARSLSGKAIVVIQEPARNLAAKNFLSAFKKHRVRIIRSNWQNHDRMMATTLAFVHMMNFAFINTLKQTNISLKEARGIGGTSFRLQLLLAEALFHESLPNEASILADNKYCQEVFATFVQQVDQVRNEIQREPQRELMDHLRTAAAYVRKDPTFHSAHVRFVTAVDASNNM